jgi:hypothetical protein
MTEVETEIEAETAETIPLHYEDPFYRGLYTGPHIFTDFLRTL